MKLVEFIKSNQNWREVLTQKPYCIDVKENGKYLLFKYNQIESDFHEPIVKESRGVILRKSDFKIVCYHLTNFTIWVNHLPRH